MTLSALVLSFAVGCALTPGLDDPRAYSPPDYFEHRVLYIRPIDGDQDRWNLLPPYKAVSGFEHLTVEPGDPLSIVVGDVYLPRDFSGTRDIAVLLDVQTSDTLDSESYVIWYERGVGPGQKLNFNSRLVYSDRAWNPAFQPWFRLRVMDVSHERNTDTRAALHDAARQVAVAGTFLPHPMLPGAAAALRAAGAVLENRQNRTIIDYTPQFYSRQFVDHAGPSDVPLFMRGSWIVIGRAKGEHEEFWRRPLTLDRRTGQVLETHGDAAPHTVISSPYMRLTIATVDAVVPSVVLGRSQLFFKILTTERPASGLVSTATEELVSSLTTYQLHAELITSRNMGALTRMFNGLSRQDLSAEDQRFLLNLASRITGQPFTDATTAAKWWDTTGHKGYVDPRTLRWSGSPPTGTASTTSTPPMPLSTR